jgi:GWxTD domain-containing protein
MNYIKRGVLLFVSSLSVCFGQTSPSANPFIMNLDYARFRNDETTGYLEIYYSFYCGQLAFNKESGTQRGAVSLHTEIQREGAVEPVVREHTVLPIVVDTGSTLALKTVVRQGGHLLAFGKYRMHVVAYDSLNPTMRDSLTLPLELREFSANPAISDLQLCSSIKPSQNKGDAFYKNSYETVPNPTLVFGQQYPVIYVYSEIYGVDTSKVYSMEYVIVDERGAEVKKVVRSRKYGISQTVEIGTMNAVSLKSGKYLIRLVLKDASTGQTSAVEKRFFVNNPTTGTVQPVSNPGALASAVEALTPQEVEQEFQQVKYLGTESEMYYFEQLKDVPSQRKFLQEFWARVEGGRDGRAPVRRADYLRKVQAANDRYTYLGKSGWRTDRGRVLILYGPPDHIERHASEAQSKPYEVWSYYQIENGVEFIFVDWTGYGDYQLVHSTKRDEIKDEEWARYLR